MSIKKRKKLIPHYLESFKCIGSSCEDSCCVGWNVDIDKKIYMKYQKVQDEELSGLFGKNIGLNTSSNKSEMYYAKINMQEDYKCPFLNEKMLCKIHMKCGEGLLSDICNTYPRFINKINGILEYSATTSCPEAARLILLNPNGIDFKEVEEESNEIRNIINNDFDTFDRRFENNPLKYFWDIRIFTITLLQDRKYRLWERLIILGMFLKKLQEHIDAKLIDDIPKIIESYTKLVEHGSFVNSLSSIPTIVSVQMELLKELTDMRYSMDKISDKRFDEYFVEFLKGIQYTKDTSIDEIGKRYSTAYSQFYEPFMKEHEYILENYLVNYVFKNIFPFSLEIIPFDAYMMLVIHYALIKMFLIGMAVFHEGLSEKLVVQFIQSFSKKVDHNLLYLKRIADIMREKKYNTVAYMAILIKN